MQTARKGAVPTKRRAARGARVRGSGVCVARMKHHPYHIDNEHQRQKVESNPTGRRAVNMSNACKN